MLKLRRLLAIDWMRTRTRMSNRIKFIGDFRYHLNRGNTLKAAFFLARNTL